MRFTKIVVCDVDVEELVEKTIDYYLDDFITIKDRIEEVRNMSADNFKYLDFVDSDYAMTIYNADDYEFSKEEYEAIEAECQKYAKEYIEKKLRALTKLLEDMGRG